MLPDLSINPQKTVEDITSFIKQTVKKAGFSRVVIGLSGGIDSSVSLSLAVRALGISNIYIGLFPYGDLDKEGMEDAKLMIKKLNIPESNIYLIDIKEMADSIVNGLKTPARCCEAPPKVGRRRLLGSGGVSKAPNITLLRKGNIIVRLRMILLYDLAKKHHVLVLGTENKTEYLLGYFTRFGDEASDIEPIRGLYKTQVRELAKYLEIPEKIIKKSPSAGMWKGQTDEDELGFTYEKADQILHLFIDLKKSREEVVKFGFKKEVIDVVDVVDKVIKRLKDNQFKHKVPYLYTPGVC